MTTVVDISEVQIKLRSLLARAREGDEIVIEENGEEIGKITPSHKKPRRERIAGLGRGTIWMSDDFNDELPDEFWGFDKSYESLVGYPRLHLVARRPYQTFTNSLRRYFRRG